MHSKYFKVLLPVFQGIETQQSRVNEVHRELTRKESDVAIFVSPSFYEEKCLNKWKIDPKHYMFLTKKTNKRAQVS